MFYILIVPVLILSIFMLIFLRSIEKHDKVLFGICQVRRKSMSYLKENYTNITSEDYYAVRRLIEALNIVINNFTEHKTRIFNLRRMIAHVKEYESFSKEVGSVNIPQNKEIRMLYKEATTSFLKGFFTYTPLLKHEAFIWFIGILFRILGKLGIRIFNSCVHNIIHAISEAREQAREYGVA